MGLARIRKINALIWIVGTIGLGLWNLDWGLAFGAGGALGVLNFSVLGWVVERFLLGSRFPLLYGFLYVTRLGAVLGVVALLIWKFDVLPLPLIAGVGTILLASVIDAAIGTKDDSSD